MATSTRKSASRTSGSRRVRPTMSDAAVAKATGKTWKEWFALLDKAGARTMTHKQIVAILTSRHRVGPWWQQMVTVEYERSRGLRKVHEKADGMFSISRSKTVPVPIATLFNAWSEPRARIKWLKD